MWITLTCLTCPQNCAIVRPSFTFCDNSEKVKERRQEWRIFLPELPPPVITIYDVTSFAAAV